MDSFWHFLIFVSYVPFTVDASLDLCPNNLPRDNYLRVFGNKCYRFRNDELNWAQARTQCSADEGHLAEVSDWGTHNNIDAEADGLRGDRVWIGLHDINKQGSWRWDNGNSLSYSNWDSDQPDTCSSCDEKCVLMRIDRSGKWHDYKCYHTYNPFVCEYDFRYCNRDPCVHGTCNNVPGGYTCTCTPGYTGSVCQTEIDECEANPCANGDCSDIVNGFVCSCVPGYTGVQCDSETNECLSDPCIHGTCNDYFNRYTCTCTAGYTGVHCETEIDECASNPCYYGTCQDHVNGYTCHCYPGYEGTYCEIETNECLSSPCQHGGCGDLVNNYTCECFLGYIGDNCQLLDPEIQKQYMNVNDTSTVKCTDTINYYGQLEAQTLDCLEETKDSLMKIESMGGLIDNFMDVGIIQDFFRIPPQSINEACQTLRNTSHLISVIYHTEIPEGSQYHWFNLGLVSSEVKILQENFCPIINDIDVLINPSDIINNRTDDGNTTYRYSDGSYGLVIISFCVPEDDICTANIHNDEVDFVINIDTYISDIAILNDSKTSVSLFNGRAYIFYDGLIQSVTIEMSCIIHNSTTFKNDTCSDNYGLVTSTPESKTLNKSDGGWDLNAKEKVLGIVNGKIMFRSRFFNTDGFNLFVILPEPLNFDSIFSNFGNNFLDSYVVFSVLVTLMVLLIIGTIVTRHYDKLDAQRNQYHCVRDVQTSDIAAYFIGIQTGMTSPRSFTYPLFMQIQGFYAESEVKAVNFCCDRVVDLERWRTAYMIFTTKKAIGPIQSLRIWVDNSDARIKISQIMIQEFAEHRRPYVFLMDSDIDGRNVTGTRYKCLKPSNVLFHEEHVLFHQVMKVRFFDDILLLSIFIRPKSDEFSRTQRLYTFTASVLLAMLSSAMWYNSVKNIPSYGISLGPISINYQQVLTGILSAVIVIPPITLIIICFYKCKPRREDLWSFDSQSRRGNKYTVLQFLTWIFVLCVMLNCIFFIFLYSLQWGGDISNQWLLSILFGFISDCFFSPLKVLIMSAFFVRFSKARSSNDIIKMPSLDINYRRIKSGKRTTSEWCDTDQQQHDVRDKSRELDRKLQIFLRNTFGSILFILVVWLLSAHDRTETSYWQNNHLKDVLIPETEVRNAGDVLQWMSSTFVPFLNGTNGYVGNANENNVASDGTTFPIGLVRIRQQINRGVEKCPKLDEYKLFSTICSATAITKEGGDFCPDWSVPTNCSVHAWFTFRKTSSSTTFGVYGIYDGGGYVIDIHLKNGNMSDIMRQIEDMGWINKKILFLSVESTILNPTTGLFSMINFRWEFSFNGPTLPMYIITSTRLYPYTISFDYIILGLQLLFLAITLIRILIFIYSVFIKTAFQGYLFTFFFDCLSLSLSVVAVSFYIYRIDRTISTVETIFNDKEKFISFNNLYWLDEIYRIFLGLLLFIHILGLLNHLSFNYHLYLMRTAMTSSISNLMSSMILIGIGILAFASLEYLTSGRKIFAYRSIHDTFFSLITSTVSLAKLSLNSSAEEDQINNVVFILFCLLINYVLINLLVSILNEALSAIKEDGISSTTHYDRELNEHFLSRLKEITSFCGLKDENDVPKQVNDSSKTSNDQNAELLKVNNFCRFITDKYIKQHGISR